MQFIYFLLIFLTVNYSIVGLPNEMEKGGGGLTLFSAYPDIKVYSQGNPSEIHHFPFTSYNFFSKFSFKGFYSILKIVRKLQHMKYIILHSP
jgi:hypothetical protein